MLRVFSFSVTTLAFRAIEYIFAMSRLSKQKVYTALRTVLDPELDVNVVDMGLIYDVVVGKMDEHPDVYIKMTLTTPGCPLGGVIIEQMREALSVYPELETRRDVRVEVVFDPPWVPDMMSGEARATLGL